MLAIFAGTIASYRFYANSSTTCTGMSANQPLTHRYAQPLIWYRVLPSNRLWQRNRHTKNLDVYERVMGRASLWFPTHYLARHMRVSVQIALVTYSTNASLAWNWGSEETSSKRNFRQALRDGDYTLVHSKYSCTCSVLIYTYTHTYTYTCTHTYTYT